VTIAGAGAGELATEVVFALLPNVVLLDVAGPRTRSATPLARCPEATGSAS